MNRHHCGRFAATPLNRRDMLRQCACGFGFVALASLLQDKAFAGVAAGDMRSRQTHFPARAKSVIFLHMDGGPSHVDTFDPKPLLTKENGQPFKMKVEPTQFNQNGNTLGSLWNFRQYGESGTPVSDLFSHVAQCVDDMAIVRSMTSEFSEHTNANYFLHTGSGLQGRPSMGAWITYGLGSECQNLPGFVVVNGGQIPTGGLDNLNSGFLPASFQGSIFRPEGDAVPNVKPAEPKAKLQQNKLSLVANLDGRLLDRTGPVDALESAISNYELGFCMQAAVPDLMNLDQETAATRQIYGLESPATRTFGRECLIARRLVERGVRFVELTCPGFRWDQHGELKVGHENNARAVDQPIGALLKDLKQRGMLEETLVVWSGEFGRTPFAQGAADGRDHNPFGFTTWLAGGGIKGGTIYGATDEYGYKAVENRVEIHDLHATMLHLLGLDHKKVTFRFGGRDMRLTDVHGELIHGILA